MINHLVFAILKYRMSKKLGIKLINEIKPAKYTYDYANLAKLAYIRTWMLHFSGLQPYLALKCITDEC